MMALASAQQPRSRSASGVQASASDKRDIMLQKYLTDCRSFYSCLYCRTHLANHDELISRSFQGNRSRAYLFNSVVNITTGPSVQRELNTGSHAVADIFCTNCGTTVGWKYEKAYVDSQKYKEGKFIIELAHVVRENRHLELDKRDMFLASQTGSPPPLSATAKAAAAAPMNHEAHYSQTTNTTTTIGQLHQGSLSPPSSSSASQWSSPRSPNSCGDHSGPRSRMDSFNQMVDEQEISDEEEEVLMFPFHDDLYGERSSYSSLSTSRLSFTRRFRRSLHLDSAPYDWKYSNKPLAMSAGEALAQPTSSMSLDQPPAEVAGHQPECTLPRAIAATSSATRQVNPAAPVQRTMSESSDDYEPDIDRDQDHHREIQFNMEACEPTDESKVCNNCDLTTNGINPRAGPSSTPPGPLVAAGSSAMVRNEPEAINTSNQSADMDSSRADSLSLDDEDFFDCCTDHQVSNSSSSSSAAAAGAAID